MTPMHGRLPGLSPQQTGPIHFIGIGGIGMSGIAEVLHNLGFSVQGSDLADGPALARLREAGVEAYAGHDAARLGDAEVVVVSSAVPQDNPELAEARRRFIPVVHRSEMMAELMRLRHSVAVAGSHGKTTVTSLTAHVLHHAGLDPTTINGGIVNSWASNARLGAGRWMVVEADESDGSFRRLPASVAVVTNCDPEHMEFWKTKAALHHAFADFIHRVPFYGFAVLCLDHPVVRALARKTQDRRVITYGFSARAEVRAEKVELTSLGMRFEAVVSPRDGAAERIGPVFLPLFGRHNVQNALAALATARGLGLDMEEAAASFADFSGVKRRFTRTALLRGASFVDDYGHHPVEIQAVLATAAEAAAAGGGKVVAVVQPHRYSRLAALMDDFCGCMDEASEVFITPVHPAGEAPLPGIDSAALVEGLRRHGHRSARLVESPEELAGQLAPLVAGGDFVVFLGAGDITKWAASVPLLLAEQWGEAAA